VKMVLMPDFRDGGVGPGHVGGVMSNPKDGFWIILYDTPKSLALIVCLSFSMPEAAA